jgi:ATP-binding cassette subfamily F protein 3
MIEFKDVSVAREGRLLFQNVNIQLHIGQKIGLTGNNGTGKSTLFATILGQHPTETGTIEMPTSWQTAHMAQEVLASEQIALDYVLSGDDEWYTLNAQIHNPIGFSEIEIAKLHQRFDEIDGYRTTAKALQILAGLGFGSDEHSRMVSSFSGGWRMRLNLARTLMKRADVLLLDEPTNHLDLDAILWLEEWLGKFTGLVLLISHDQAFLDTVCGHILHIEQGAITLYTGNYSQFVRTRAERLAQQQQAFEKQQATKAHLEDYIRRFRAKATKAKQAQSRIKQLERMSELSPVMADSPFSFAFYPPASMSSPLISLDNAVIGYNADKPLVNKLTLQITPDTRLGVLGANGAGKSTLIKALAGELPLISGVHKTAQNLQLGYFNQHQMDALDNDASPIVMLRRLAGQTSDVDLRAFLGSFDFRGDKIDTPCLAFSGGERARLTLALIVWQRPNVLILDEPTNHLDLDMRNALMLALGAYQGALILVSHDRDLITTVCDSLVLVAHGACREFTGDMNDYATHLKEMRLAKLQNDKADKTDKPNDSISKEDKRKLAAQNRQKTAPLRKEIDKLEKDLEQLYQKLAKISEQLSDNSLYDDVNKEKLLDLLDNQAKVQKDTDTLEEALLIKMDELETLQDSL